MGDERTCRKCDIGWGLIGVGFGLLILAIGADLLTGGALTDLFTRSGRNLATVIPLGDSADDSAS